MTLTTLPRPGIAPLNDSDEPSLDGPLLPEVFAADEAEDGDLDEFDEDDFDDEFDDDFEEELDDEYDLLDAEVTDEDLMEDDSDLPMGGEFDDDDEDGSPDKEPPEEDE